MPKKKISLEPPSPLVNEREVRVKEAHKALGEVLKKYNCSLNVRSLNIESGRILPEIVIVAL
jgi:hypothetical protein